MSSLFHAPRRWLENNYGGSGALLRLLWSHLLRFSLQLRQFQRVDWSRVERVVFVCSGNICRSAFAEYLASTRGMRVASCGLDAPDGDPAHPLTLEESARRDLHLDTHRTTAFGSFEWRSSDLAVCADLDIGKRTLERFSAANIPAQTTLLGLWADPVCPTIQDPYSRGPAYFSRCFDRIESAVDGLHRRCVNSRHSA